MTDYSLNAVIGWPVAHSLSPIIHNYWNTKYNKVRIYKKISINPDKEFLTEIKKLYQEGYTGLNITIPYKENANKCADRHSQEAQRLEVSNCLTLMPGDTEPVILADNTDAWGFQSAIENKLTLTDLPRALIFGAGGAVPALCLGLERLGFHAIDIANRSKDKADRLKEKFSAVDQIYKFEPEKINYAAYDVVINATPLGMTGFPKLKPDFSKCKKTCLITDIVYSPINTEFIKAGKRAGLTTCHGLWMLLYQAQKSYETWYKITPEIDQSLIDRLQSILERREKHIIQIGLTGSIGSGKSTTASLFSELGAARWDADQAVHNLYEKGGAAIKPMTEHFPDCVVEGAIDRQKLSADLMKNQDDFVKLEHIIHPLLQQSKDQAVSMAMKAGHDIIVFDVPLLFETDQAHLYDATIACITDEAVRRARVLERDHMTAEKYDTINLRQMSQKEKKLRADFSIATDTGVDVARRRVAQIYNYLLENYSH